MDSFINLAKQGLETYTDSQKKPSSSEQHGSDTSTPSHGQQGSQHDSQQFGAQSGAQSGGGYGGQQTSNHGTQQEGQYGVPPPGFGDQQSGRYSPPIDKNEAINTAKAHGSGDSSLFDTALSFLSNNKSTQQEPINEDEVTKAHDKVYNQGNTSGLSANLLGSAAAMQVLKQFTGGSAASTGSSNSQTSLVSLAMAEATKLFDKSSGPASGDKQDAVNGAAMTIMKLLVQSKLGGGDPTVGGKDSGGLGGLLSLANKFV